MNSLMASTMLSKNKLALTHQLQNQNVTRLMPSLNATSIQSCIPLAINQFPTDVLTDIERERGGIVLHIFATIYIFGCLAYLCDRYFVPSLESFTERMNIQPEVAGASLMAIGNSAPELFTSLIGVYVSEDDVGVGTVVGSAVFNILFVVGSCILVAPTVLHLEVYPILRDASFYVLSLIALAIICLDGKADWYDAVILVVLYVLYMVIIYNSRKIEQRIHGFFTRIKTNESNDAEIDLSYGVEKNVGIDVLRSDCNISEEGESTIGCLFHMPDSKLKRAMWVFGFPVILLFFITIPDASKPKSHKWFILTFIMCMIYMGSFSYLMVYFVTIIGYTFGIPDIVMGLVVIACGCNPDAIATILIAKHGKGRMSISNCIGANIFHILLSLGLPWFTRTLITHHGQSVDIISGSIKFTIFMLIGSVIAMISIFLICKWKLRWPAGLMLILTYLCLITIACLFEMNVFGSFTLPYCE